MALMGLSLQMLMSFMFNDCCKNKPVWEQKTDMNIRSIFVKSQLPKKFQRPLWETTLKHGVQMRCYALLWIAVFFHFTKGSESNDHHWQMGNIASKVSGGAGPLPDLTLNLFVGYIPVQVTWIMEWWRKSSTKCWFSDLSCNQFGTQSRVANFFKIAVLVFSHIEEMAWL